MRRQNRMVTLGYKIRNSTIESPELLQLFYLRIPGYPIRVRDLLVADVPRTNYGFSLSIQRITRLLNKPTSDEIEVVVDQL